MCAQRKREGKGHGGGERGRFREALPYAEESANILENIGHTDKASQARQLAATIRATLGRQLSGAGGVAIAMRTYRNEMHGFEIDIPEDWSQYHDKHVDVAFAGGGKEILNIVIESMMPEPSPGSTQLLLTSYAQAAGFTDVKFGRMAIGGKDHTCASYVAVNRVWTKKYMIVLSGKGFAITASCNAQATFLQREKVWDAIASSFRLLAPLRG